MNSGPKKSPAIDRLLIRSYYYDLSLIISRFRCSQIAVQKTAETSNLKYHQWRHGSEPGDVATVKRLSRNRAFLFQEKKEKSKSTHDRAE